MVDNTNPTSQFHPYQPPDAIPHKDAPLAGNGFSDMIGRARDMARSNPGAILGGLAALAIGAGLLRKRGMQ